jgi:OOP family OmpA-OmpF porin
MKKIILLLLLLVIMHLNAQPYRGNYGEWSVEFNMGLNKPYNTLTPGYATSKVSLYHIDSGIRYTINPYWGIKLDIGYDKLQSKKNLTPLESSFETNYVRMNLQAVADLGYALNLYNYADPIGIFFHAGAGVSTFDTDFDARKEKLINLIYGFTGTLKISRNMSLSGDISSLMHLKQDFNFDGRTPVKSKSAVQNNLLNSSVGIIYFFKR